MPWFFSSGDSSKEKNHELAFVDFFLICDRLPYGEGKSTVASLGEQEEVGVEADSVGCRPSREQTA